VKGWLVALFQHKQVINQNSEYNVFGAYGSFSQEQPPNHEKWPNVRKLSQKPQDKQLELRRIESTQV